MIKEEAFIAVPKEVTRLLKAFRKDSGNEFDTVIEFYAQAIKKALK